MFPRRFYFYRVYSAPHSVNWCSTSCHSCFHPNMVSIMACVTFPCSSSRYCIKRLLRLYIYFVSSVGQPLLFDEKLDGHSRFTWLGLSLHRIGAFPIWLAFSPFTVHVLCCVLRAGPQIQGSSKVCVGGSGPFIAVGSPSSEWH